VTDSHITDLAPSTLTKNLFTVFTGNISAAAIGFLTILIISRMLTVNDFGLFNLAISFMLIGSAVSALGMQTPMVKFVSSYLAVQKTAEANHVLKITLAVRMITGVLLAFIAFNTAEIISTKVYNYPDLTPLLKVASFGIIGVTIFNYMRSALHAYHLFKWSVILQILVDIGKLSITVVLIFLLGRLDASAAVTAFAVAPILGFFLGLWRLRNSLMLQKNAVFSIVGRLFSYSKWTFLANACNMAFRFTGIFMLAKMSGSEAVGTYGLAVNLTLIFPIVISSLIAVLLPRVSRFREIQQFKDYYKVSLIISLCLGAPTIMFLFVSHKIIPFFFGLKYYDSIHVFNWLLLSALMLAANSTMRIALYSTNKPNIVAAVNLLRLLGMVIGCYLLIPLLGTLAPAVLSLFLNAAVLIFNSRYVFSHIHSGDIEFIEEEELIETY